MSLFVRKQRRPIRQEETRPLPFHPPLSPEHAQTYRLKRSSARRTLVLRVSEGGEIAVNAPLKLAQTEIDLFLFRNADWLRQRLAAVTRSDVQWRTGAALPWRGGSLNLVVLETAGRCGVRLQGDTLICTGGELQIEAVVRRWYQRQARALLAERLAHHAARAGLSLPPMRLSDARTRWGSLSGKGVVSLNWRLIKASPEALDYVVCHELAHFRQRNHSAAFWHEVAVLFPDYLSVRASLKRNGRHYFEW